MNSNIEQIWDQAKELLKDEMSQISHKTWIEPLKISSIVDNNIILISEDSFKRDMADTKFHDLIMNTFSVILQKNCNISIVCKDELPEIEKEPEIQVASSNNSYSNTSLNPKYCFSTLLLVIIIDLPMLLHLQLQNHLLLHIIHCFYMEE